MSEWVSHKLSDLMEIIGGGTPKTNVASYWNGDIPWLSVVDFNSGLKHVRNTEKQISQEGLENSSTKMLNKRDIIISARGTVGAMAMLETPMTFNQSCYGLRFKYPLNSQDYLFYLVKNSINELMQISHGGVFDTITKATFDEVTVNVPEDETEQHAIAEVLSSLDDKIDLLHRNNKTLEEMAETLFRQWFDMSETSKLKLGHIGDFFEETIGGEWGKETLNEEFSVEAICIRGTDIGNLIDGIPSPPTRYLSDKKFQKCKVLHGDIIIEISGGTEDQSTGRARYFDTKTIEMLGGSVVFSNFCRLLRPINKEIYPYLYLLLRFLYDRGDFFNLENGTSGIKNLALKPFLNDELYPIPDIETAIKFSQQVLPLLNKTGYNRIQINNLSKLRDTLLPKLMSGQVVVH